MPLCLPGLPDGNSTRIYKRKCKEPVKNGTAPLKNGTAPHHLASLGASPRRGSRERGLSIKRLFDEKMPDCCSAAPHSSKASLCPPSPRGEGLERGRNLNRPLSSAYADTFPATVGFFALFSLRRKSEKGESKDKAADDRHFPRRGKQGGGSAPMGKARGVSTL